MEPDLRVRYRTLDPVVVGSRVREARIRAGLTQRDAAGDDVSPAYVSRIESGVRRAALDLLDRMALRLGTSLEELLAPDTDSSADFDEVARLRLELDYAELSLQTGDPERALEGAASVARDLSAPGELRRDARVIEALALEASGETNRAVSALEALVPGEVNDVRLILTLTALCRCYRELGELGHAVDVGRRAEDRLGAAALMGGTEGVQLALTLAGAHYERGDTAEATRICMRALDAAEELDSSVAKASAYWNTSIIESREGRVHAALTLAHKALALLEPSNDARRIAILRQQVGILHLRSTPPHLDEAVEILSRSRRDLETTSARPIDRASNDLALARAHFLKGDLDEAARLADACRDIADPDYPMVVADVLVLNGQLAAERCDVDTAVQRFREAATTLTGIGADRSVAEIWLELAGILEELGHVGEALSAYRSATASAGIAPRHHHAASRPLRVAATS